MRIVRSTLCCLLALGPFSVWAAPPAADEIALRRIKEIEWPKAYREQDEQLLDRILAAEFQSIDADGAWSSKSEELDYIRRHKQSHVLRFIIKRLQIFENGTAVVSGTGLVTEGGGTERVVTEYQSSNIFIKRDGRWQAIASHVSGVKERANSQ